MFESPVKQSLSQSPEDARQPVATVFYLYLTEGAIYRSANAVYRLDHKFSLPSHVVPPLGVTRFKLMKKLYGS